MGGVATVGRWQEPPRRHEDRLEAIRLEAVGQKVGQRLRQLYFAFASWLSLSRLGVLAVGCQLNVPTAISP